MTECLSAVDIHVHAVPRQLVDRVGRGELDGVTLVSGGPTPVLGFPGMAPSPPVPAASTDAPALLRMAEGQHIDLQLLGPWTDLFGYTLGEAAAVAWCRAYNEELVAMCARSPRQVPMATVPLSYPEAAAREVTAARALGCHGVMIGTDVPDLDLGSAELDVVWAAAARCGMPVLVHPTQLRVAQELQVAGLKNAVGRAAPTALALTQLVYSGALERHPHLKVVGCHAGGAFAAVRPRVLRNHDLGWSGSNADVNSAIDRLLFDTVVLDPALLAYLVRTHGPSAFALGSDNPFPWEPDPIGTLLDADLPAEHVAAIAGLNARGWYGLPPPRPCPVCAVDDSTVEPGPAP